MIKNLPTLFLLCCAPAAHAQLFVGSGGLTVKGGTTFSTDSLALAPSADLSLSNITIIPDYTPASTSTGGSIARIYAFSQPIAFAGSVVLRYAASELAGNAASTLELSYNDGAVWTTTSGSASNTAAYTVSNSFGSPMTLTGFTAAPSSTPLSIRLAAFSAMESDENAVLSWKATATTSDRFEVEHSKDARHFNRIGTVPAQQGLREYETTHAQPGNGTHYYRLKIADGSGRIAYSATRAVVFDALASVALYPNPAHASITVTGLAAGDAIRVADAAGRLMHSYIAEGHLDKLDVRAWPAGHYTLQVAKASGAGQTLRLVKQ